MKNITHYFGSPSEDKEKSSSNPPPCKKTLKSKKLLNKSDSKHFKSMENVEEDKRGKNKKRKQKNIESNENVNLDEKSNISTPSPSINAFQFMMESRHKVIGRNSPGKELKEDSNESLKENKEILATRKNILQEWTDSKSSKKRKCDDVERSLYISKVLEKRTKRMKKLLNNDNKEVKKCRKVKKKSMTIDSDSDSENNFEDIKEDKKSTKNSSEVLPEDQKSTKRQLRSSKNWTTKLKVNFSEDHEIEIKTNDDNDKQVVNFQTKKERNKRKHDLNVEEKKRKLAPVFVKNNRKSDKAALEAKQNFLASGLPTLLIKTIEKQKSFSADIDHKYFPTTSHVFSNSYREQLKYFTNLPEVTLKLTENNDKIILNTFDVSQWKSITNSEPLSNAINSNTSFTRITKFQKLLKSIKNNDPNYPLLKAFKISRQKYLEALKPVNTAVKIENLENKKMSKKGKKKVRKKSEESEIPSNSLTWPEKYKPSCFGEIFGNFSCAKEFKKWLESWIKFRSEINSQRRKSSSSDDFELGDSNSANNCLPSNTLVLVGPHGSGKTTLVYAVCNELGINILELNASTKRTGKRLLQEIHEATQSHQVRNSHLGSITSFYEPSTSKSSEKSSKICLLLVEDVDIVFEQDEGFLSALGQILLTSKRPVIITSSDPSCLHLQKFVDQYHTLTFAPMSSKILGGWLQMVCLAEGVLVEKKSLCDLLEACNGDARKCLLQLQFWINSGGNVARKSPEFVCNTIENSNIEDGVVDENSNDSFFKTDEDGLNEELEIHDICMNYSVERANSRVWWNLIDLEKGKVGHVSNYLDLLSLSDCFDNHGDFNGGEPVGKFWDRNAMNSLSLTHSMEGFESPKELLRDMNHFICEKLIKDLKCSSNSFVPSTDKIRWKIKRHNSDEALFQIIPQCSFLDKKAATIDYLPALRNIAKAEALRLSVNDKRGNRFYHYLRGLGLNVNDSCIKTASETFK